MVENDIKRVKKREYEPPHLTVVSFQAERGYAASLSEVADELDRWAQGDLQIIGSLSDNELWQASQDVSGVGTASDGLQAGYFYQEQTDGWFQ